MPHIPVGDLQQLVDVLCSRAVVPPATVESSAGLQPFIWVRRDPGGHNAHIRVDDWWFEITDHVTLCLCGHSSHTHDPTARGGCSVCDCVEFETDGMSAAELQRQSIEAILAHEVAHLHQDVHGEKPSGEVETEHDADHRAVQILPSHDPNQLIRALRYTGHFAAQSDTTHGSTEERVARLKANWPGTEPIECERPLRRAERQPLRKHVDKLLSEHALTWLPDQSYWLTSYGEPDARIIHTPPLRNEMDYLAAVHEIGHFALDLPTHADDGETVLFENEERVWIWALEQLPQPPSESARASIFGCFMSYENQIAPADVRARMRNLLEADEQLASSEDQPPPLPSQS